MDLLIVTVEHFRKSSKSNAIRLLVLTDFEIFIKSYHFNLVLF